MRGAGYDFSFSGLKTAVVTHRRAEPDQAVADVAASFQEAAVDVLAEKLSALGREVGARALVLGGGVAANSRLRARVAAEADAMGVPALLPAMEYCTDNAAMIAAAGAFRFRAGTTVSPSFSAHASLPLPGMLDATADSGARASSRR
jgi:N6-L-threonylcarbamoyladenine synthase